MINTEARKIHVTGSLRVHDVPVLLGIAGELERKKQAGSVQVSVEADTVIDSAGIGALLQLYNQTGVELYVSRDIEERIKEFAKRTDFEPAGEKDLSLLDRLTLRYIEFQKKGADFVVMAADIFAWSIRGLFSGEGRRKGSVYEQIVMMGNKAVPIIVLLSLLLGLILSLQSAAQLRDFGADIFLVDLITISMVTEMGPMITAIIVAGRSGSSIAAEIATMEITEELDALKVMALHPYRFVVVPKMLSMTVALPALTIIANIVGIVGGFIVATMYLELSPQMFFDRSFMMMSVSMWRDSLVKSVIFSWLIVLIGVYFGLNVKGGAEGVGRATTSSVVAAIFAVIMADAMLSIVFYFEF